MLSSQADLYVQVWRSRLVAENLRTGERFSVEEGFGHPRLLIGDFLRAETALRRATEHVFGPGQRPRRLLMHAQEELDGGLSEVELRVMREAALGTGAREIWLYRSPRKLTRDDVNRLLNGTGDPDLMGPRTA